MLITKIKWMLPIMMLLFLGSCSNDADTDVLADEFGNGRNDGNRPSRGGSQNDFDVSELDSKVLTDWADVFLKVDRYAYGMRPNATARAIAYINLASYEVAAPLMRDYDSNSRRLNGLQINDRNLPRNLNLEVALNTAYADVLHHFMINVANNAKDEIDVLEEAFESDLSSNISQSVLVDSREWGSYVAQQVIAYSQTDTEAETQILEPQPDSYEPAVAAGNWTYSAAPERALFPYWGSVRTFVISPEKTSSVAPLQYSTDVNSEYYKQMEEVFEVNNKAKEEQNDDLWIAEFWSDDVEGLMMSPPARQVSIAKQLIEQENLNLQSALVLMVKLGFSLNDAAVSTWADKYEHMVMRPNVFIHEFIDPSFQTNLFRLVYWPNPSFPGYPSGHSCFASAAAGVFIDQFGDDTFFTDKTHEGRTEFLGSARTFNTLSEMARENAYSRIPLGVHVRMDCDEGIRLGYEISEAVNALKLDKING